MTSKYNDQVTKDFFKKNKFFGLDENKIVFFQQEMISAIDFNGKLFLKSKSEIFQNPNGTGGVYPALEKSGILNQMEKDGIEYFSFINVDNPIVEIFDPAFIGETIHNKSEFGIKCVKKVNPEERVGLVGVIDNKTYILEYFKLPTEINDKTNEDGSLYLNASNLNILMIKRSFVHKVLKEDLLTYSVANKKIPYINKFKEKVKPMINNGFKFEKFVFDVIPLAKNPFVIMTKREEEFAPVKNAEGNDSPMTSRLLMNRKAKKWMLNAGIDQELIDQLEFVEVSPLFALTESDFIKKVKNNIEFYENEMVDVESFYFD